MKFLSRIVVLALFSLPLVAGCDGGDGMGSTTRVKGTVKVDGAPLKDGTITFHPDASQKNDSKHVPVGHITDGQYIMTTNGKDVVPLGFYKVSIRAEVPSNPKDEYSAPKSLINERFNDPEHSGLTAEVVSSEKPYDFEVLK